jgi:Rrf2 family transcriptional regulator, repressor of oqxAB
MRDFHGSGWFPVAVQALVVLAETDGLCSSGTMALGLKAHAVFVRRVLTHLVHANIIQAREGRDGGYRLARPAETITLAQIFQAVHLADQTEDTTDRSSVNAQVQAILDEIDIEAERQVLGVLEEHTLASVLARVGVAHRSA